MDHLGWLARDTFVCCATCTSTLPDPRHAAWFQVPSREGRKKQGRQLQLQQLLNEAAVYQALAPLQGRFIPTLVAHG